MKKVILAGVLGTILSAGITLDVQAENTNLYFSAFDEKIIWNKLELSSDQLDLLKQGSVLACEAITSEKFEELSGPESTEWNEEYQGLEIGAKVTISMMYIEDTFSYGVHVKTQLPDSRSSHATTFIEDLIGAYIGSTSEIGDYNNSLSVMFVGEKYFSGMDESNKLNLKVIKILSSEEFLELNARPAARVDQGFFCMLFNLFDMNL